LTSFVKTGIITVWNPATTTVEVKGRLPVIPQERNGGICIAPAGNFSREVIHITLIFEIIGVIGSVASVVSLAVMLHDKRCDRKEKVRSSGGTKQLAGAEKGRRRRDKQSSLRVFEG